MLQQKSFLSFRLPTKFFFFCILQQTIFKNETIKRQKNRLQELILAITYSTVSMNADKKKKKP